MVILPLAAFTRRSPVTSPIHVSPLEFLTTAVPSTLPIRTAPEPVVTSASAGGPSDRDVAGARSQVERAGLVERGCRRRRSCSGTRRGDRWQRNAATPASPRTCDPVGSEICTSIESPPRAEATAASPSEP